MSKSTDKSPSLSAGPDSTPVVVSEPVVVAEVEHDDGFTGGLYPKHVQKLLDQASARAETQRLADEIAAKEAEKGK